MIAFNVAYIIAVVLSITVLIWARKIKGCTDAYYIPVKNKKGIYFELTPVRKIATIALAVALITYLPALLVVVM